MLNGLQKHLQAIDKNTRLALVFAAIATVLALVMNFSGSEPADRRPEVQTSSEDIDTFIPAGFSLVPIEVINSNGLDSILGRYGMVDLFLENQKSALIKNVRLIRGIRNSDSWAVLVQSSFVQELLSTGGRFLVSVRSRNNQGSQIIKNLPKVKRTIIYGE